MARRAVPTIQARKASLPMWAGVGTWGVVDSAGINRATRASPTGLTTVAPRSHFQRSCRTLGEGALRSTFTRRARQISTISCWQSSRHRSERLASVVAWS